MTGALNALLAAASSKSTTSSGSSTTFIVFLVLIAIVGYFLLIRPQKQKQRRLRDQQQQIGVGDEIVTAGGIVGKVIAMEADRVTILSGEDTVGFPAVGNEPARIVLVRNAISRKVDPPVPDAPDTSYDDPDETADDGPHSLNGHVDGHLDGDGGHDGTDAALGGGAGEGAESGSEGTTS